MTSPLSLTEAAVRLSAKAAEAGSGRAAEPVVHGDRFRQVLLALRAGHALADHDNPGEASLQCLSGAVTLSAGDDSWDLGPGDVVLIPDGRHRVDAREDSVVLLSVVRVEAADAQV